MYRAVLLYSPAGIIRRKFNFPLCTEADFAAMPLRHYLARSLAPILFDSTELNNKPQRAGLSQL
jgi:hypothetical protein